MEHTPTHGSESFHKEVTLAGSLIAIGIVFGDLGTSPLYTLNAVFHGKVISEIVALGSLSCIFWTLFFQTTLKYVILTLKADNHGEGGIFSLYALVRRFSHKGLLWVAIAGGAFLMADGIITPPISVASAIEGLRAEIPSLNTVPIVIAILIALFVMQQFGTSVIGKVFGPVMVIWFSFIGIIGVIALSENWTVIQALNPYYAYILLTEHPGGFWLLGSLFLCTTGAEALYSDMGHCGRNNIRASWVFIKITLILSYAGQTAWLVNHAGQKLDNLSPFYHSVPDSLYLPAIIIATLAAIIASQALISGCFTLINEAIRLNIWPKHLVNFPSDIKGQLYIPFINWGLMIGCIAMVLYFEESTNMEAAFGLSVTLTMLMSTILVYFYLKITRTNLFLRICITLLFLTVESSFLIANLQKVKEGGGVILLIGSVLCAVMYIWSKGVTMKGKLQKFVELKNYLPILKKLSLDNNISKYATNIVYLTTSQNENTIEEPIINSILYEGLPKRADVYWFVHINITDIPYEQSYSVKTITKDDVYFVNFNLGFREEPRIGNLFKQVVNEMVVSGELSVPNSAEYEYQNSVTGDFQFIINESFLSYGNKLSFWKTFIMKAYFNLSSFFSVKRTVLYGLDPNMTKIEKHPLIIQPYISNTLKRK